MTDLFELFEEIAQTPLMLAGEKAILVDKMKEARESYYNSSPTMSDAEYDVLEIRLRELDPNNPLLTEVGKSVPQQGTWPKVKHGFMPMGSLDKIMPDDKAKDSKVNSGVRDWWAKTELALRG